MSTHAQQWAAFIAALARDVRATRKVLGWSQMKLADVALLSQGTISRLESGDCLNAPFRTVFQALTTLAAACGPLEVAVPPRIRGLIADTSDPIPLDPDFAALLHAYHDLPDRHRAWFVKMSTEVAQILTRATGDPP